MRPINTFSANQDHLTTPQSIGYARSYPLKSELIVDWGQESRQLIALVKMWFGPELNPSLQITSRMPTTRSPNHVGNVAVYLPYSGWLQLDQSTHFLSIPSLSAINGPIPLEN